MLFFPTFGTYKLVLSHTPDPLNVCTMKSGLIVAENMVRLARGCTEKIILYQWFKRSLTVLWNGFECVHKCAAINEYVT